MGVRNNSLYAYLNSPLPFNRKSSNILGSRIKLGPLECNLTLKYYFPDQLKLTRPPRNTMKKQLETLPSLRLHPANKSNAI